MIPDLSVLIVMAATGRITRRDWQVIDAVHVRKLGIRAASRELGVSHEAVRKRVKKVATILKKKPFISDGFD